MQQFVSSTVLFLLSTVSTVTAQLDPNQIQSFHPRCTDRGKGVRDEGGKRQTSCAHSVSGVVVESILCGKRFLQLKCGCLCIQ